MVFCHPLWNKKYRHRECSAGVSTLFLEGREEAPDFSGSKAICVSAAAVDRTYVGECGCVPAKLHFQEQKMGWCVRGPWCASAFLWCSGKNRVLGEWLSFRFKPKLCCLPAASRAEHSGLRLQVRAEQVLAQTCQAYWEEEATHEAHRHASVHCARGWHGVCVFLSWSLKWLESFHEYIQYDTMEIR